MNSRGSTIFGSKTGCGEFIVGSTIERVIRISVRADVYGPPHLAHPLALSVTALSGLRRSRPSGSDQANQAYNALPPRLDEDNEHIKPIAGWRVAFRAH
jgi:hypothetical protein